MRQHHLPDSDSHSAALNVETARRTLEMDTLETEGTNDMDRITQLQDGILDLVRLTQKSLEDLTKLTPLVPIDEEVYPPAETKKDREKVQTLSPEQFEKHKVDLVREFVQRAKEVEILIDVMPSKQEAEAINARIESMEPEMRAANADYKQALAEVQALHDEYKASLAALLASSTQGSLLSSG
ncbi:hypothetical protein NCC49_001929 [Naganishia albida]|nr:hypothetical protein NCC49_001929 [Naganishia albida]